MIRLPARISFAGGAEAITRLVATALGLALGVSLLYAAAALPALHAHDVRAGWRATSAHNRRPAQDGATTDPLLWRFQDDLFHGRALIRVDVAAEGPHAPVPPGLTRLPGPGQLAVSPALARLLQTTDPALLGDRFGGQVAATVGPAALVVADDLVVVVVVVVGHTPAQLRAEGGVTQVRSIESAPVSHSITDFLRIILVIGGIGLIVPVMVLVATATRLAAARREHAWRPAPGRCDSRADGHRRRGRSRARRARRHHHRRRRLLRHQAGRRPHPLRRLDVLRLRPAPAAGLDGGDRAGCPRVVGGCRDHLPAEGQRLAAGVVGAARPPGPAPAASSPWRSGRPCWPSRWPAPPTAGTRACWSWLAGPSPSSSSGSCWPDRG
jgi:hypothetical protein